MMTEIINELTYYLKGLDEGTLTLPHVTDNLNALKKTNTVTSNEKLSILFHAILYPGWDDCLEIGITMSKIKFLLQGVAKISKPDSAAKQATGLSVDYYKLHIKHPIHFPEYYCECGDIIEALGMTFNEGEAFKAIWRRAAARSGNAKENTTSLYDAEKVIYYANRILANEIHKPSEGIFDLSGIEGSM